MTVETQEVLDFLKEWKSAAQTKKYFDLSQNASYHLFRWLMKAGLVKRCKAQTTDELKNYDGRIYLYMTKKN